MSQVEGKKIGLIGAGNMGSAILEGLVAREIALPGDLAVFDPVEEKARYLSQRIKGRALASNGELVAESDIILLAVKPQDLAGLGKEISAELNERHIVVSILAGVSMERLREVLGSKPSLVRAMPNLGARVGSSLTALASDCEESLLLSEEIFSGCGRTLRLEESFFDLITALSGSGPAYFFLLMEMIASQAESKGLEAGMARKIAVQTAAGAALLALQAEEGPARLREMVTSKGGTTAAALTVLEEGKVRDLFCKAFEAAEERSAQLRKS